MTLILLIPSNTDVLICFESLLLMPVSYTTVWAGTFFPLTFTDRIVFLSFFWFLIYHLQGFRLCAREVCRAGEPQQNEAEHGPWSPGLGLWLQPPTLHGWSKSHENRYRVQGMVLRALNHTKANLIYYFNLPSSCCVPQFLVWNPTWLVRAAAFQSLWPSRRPQDATSCCFQLDHLTMELTPRMKSSTGKFVTTFNMTLILTQIIYVDFNSEFLYFMFN